MDLSDPKRKSVHITSQGDALNPPRNRVQVARLLMHQIRPPKANIRQMNGAFAREKLCYLGPTLIRDGNSALDVLGLTFGEVRKVIVNCGCFGRNIHRSGHH